MGVTGVVRYSGWLRCLLYRARQGTVLMVYLVPTVKYRTGIALCSRGGVVGGGVLCFPVG